MQRPEIVELDAVEWVEEDEGVRARVGRVRGGRWALVEYAPRSERHEWCMDGHVGYILAGTIEYELEGGGMIEVGAGSCFVLPAGQRHRGRNRGREMARLLVIDDPD